MSTVLHKNNTDMGTYALKQREARDRAAQIKTEREEKDALKFTGQPQLSTR